MWEVSETILHHVKGDVLVIFDCCDTKHLTKLRSIGRAFEYLGACNRSTHGPGENSFTSALTWALKELSGESPFRTDRLVSKIKEHRLFPDKQEPVLFPRWEFMPENIWIERTRTQTSLTPSMRRHSSAPEFRDENCDYVDFRVTFSQPLSDEDGKAVAKLMEPLVYNRNSPLTARHVAYIEKGTCKPSANPMALWTRARNHVVYSNRFASMDGSRTLQSSKRKRSSLETQAGESTRTKYSKSSVIWDMERTAPFNAISSSPEETLNLRIDTTITPTTASFESPYEVQTDSVAAVDALLQGFMKLKKDSEHQPELYGRLQSQIRAIFAD